MPLYKVAKFAEMTGKKPKDIHAYVAQNKLVKTKEGFIDTDTTINNTFLSKHQGKVLEKELTDLETGQGASAAGKKDAYFLDVKRGEYLDIQIQKGKIEIEKKHGEVFPVELVKELTVRHAKSLTSAYRQNMERLLDLWGVKFKIPNGDIMKALKEMGEALNKAQMDAIETTKAEMKAVAKEYGSKKGVGEHE